MPKGEPHLDEDNQHERSTGERSGSGVTPNIRETGHEKRENRVHEAHRVNRRSGNFNIIYGGTP